MSIDAGHTILRNRAAYASVVVSAVLIAVKFFAWLATGSVAMLSSLVDSLLDVVAAAVNLFAIRHASEPADREHRFGHGKAEPLAALGQAAFLAGGALLVTFEAINRIVTPAPISRATLGIAVMVVSIVIDGVLVLYQRYVVAKTGSLAIGADELHFRSDMLVNAAVLAALILDRFVGSPILDPLFGGAIGLVDHLWLDASIPTVADPADGPRAARYRSAPASAPSPRPRPRSPRYTICKTRTAGPTAFIQLHIEMDGAMDLLHAHEIADAVEAQLRGAYPNAEIIIHQDPAGLEEPRQAFPPRVKAG